LGRVWRQMHLPPAFEIIGTMPNLVLCSLVGVSPFKLINSTEYII